MAGRGTIKSLSKAAVFVYCGFSRSKRDMLTSEYHRMTAHVRQGGVDRPHDTKKGAAGYVRLPP